MVNESFFKFVKDTMIENAKLKVILAFQTSWMFWLTIELIKQYTKKEKNKKEGA